MLNAYITVFTSTYNREKLLYRLYDSLRNQQKKNFEWIIIDDASKDNTEDVVRGWIEDSKGDFVIRYYKQEHGGKHRALNRGFNLANGMYFFIVDSDDYLTENATAKVEEWGRFVENDSRIAGVSGLKVTEQGIVGGDPKIDSDKEWIEASNFERGKYNLWGDKAEVYKTEILKKYPFPEFEDEYFVTEAVCWDAIAADGYKLRWYNYPIYMCEYLEDGLTKSGANEMKGNIDNYNGFCYYVSQCLKVKCPWEWFGNLRRYNRVARALHKNWVQRSRDLRIDLYAYIKIMLWTMPIIAVAKCVNKLLPIKKG